MRTAKKITNRKESVDLHGNWKTVSPASITAETCGINPGLFCAGRLPRGFQREVVRAVSYAHRFNEEVTRPIILDHDLKTFEDPDYMPLELIDKANEWGFYTMFIPKIYGGKGVSMFTMPYVMEELASVCAGMANVIGVHYLGLLPILGALNGKLAHRIIGEVIEGEHSGNPCLISLAITEPGAGTDVEETDLKDRARLSCQARRAEGGYVVNGSKVFISMGHVSTWCSLITWEQGKKPSEGEVTFAVKTGTKGFSFGRHEDKMGQRVCPASELVFDDCFLSDDFVLADGRYKQGLPSRAMGEHSLHVGLGMSRAAVSAFGTGVARGAYEDALDFAAKTRVDGRFLIDQEWAQYILSQMYMNMMLGKLAYSECLYADIVSGGLASLMLKNGLYYYLKLVPASMLRAFFSPFMKSSRFPKFMAKAMAKNLNMKSAYYTSGFGSMAKIVGTDMGMRNSQLALELTGQAGIRHDRGIEKRLRDAKLLQIYEGTNQLNQINLFNCHIARNLDGVKILED